MINLVLQHTEIQSRYETEIFSESSYSLSQKTKQKLAQTRAGQTRGRRSRSRRHRPPRKRWEEARGGRRPQPTMEDPSPDDAGQTTGRRSRRAGRDEGGSRTLRRSAGGCTKSWPAHVFLAKLYLYSFSVFFPYSCPKQGLYSRIRQEYSSK